MGDANTKSVAMPESCAICGSKAPEQTFEQRVRKARLPKNAYGNKRYENITLPVCDSCLKSHKRICMILQIIYSITIIIGAILGFYTLYLLYALPNMIMLEPWAYAVGVTFAITLVAFYLERWFEHRYVKRDKSGALTFRNPAFNQAYSAQEN